MAHEEDKINLSTSSAIQSNGDLSVENISENKRKQCCTVQSFVSLAHRFPRASSVLFGVIIPLWVLVLLSAVFGLIVAISEAPNEIQRNDVIAANRLIAANLTTILERTQRLMPLICWSLYTSGYTGDSDLIKLIKEQFYKRFDETDVFLQSEVGEVDVNERTFVNFTNLCTNAVSNVTTELLSTTIDFSSATSINDMTFNWIICTPQGQGLGNRWKSMPTNEARRPEAQANQFLATWKNSQQLFFDSLYEQTDNVSELEAYNVSVKEASGGSTCGYNIAGSGWFWFTIMSTMGYGNQIPYTRTSRSMIFTFGFLSILTFAAILSIAGCIVSAIVDDALVRLKLTWLTKPGPTCLLWGSVYYIWMLVIGIMSKTWKRYRLGVYLSPSDSYWFAYISTTSVGFGDIYFEPEVFTVGDLLTFPIVFLVGFVFLAAFLERFATFMNDKLRGKDTPFLTSLLSTLAKSDFTGESPQHSNLEIQLSNERTQLEDVVAESASG